MNILAIETSCDETSVAILKGESSKQVTVLSNIISSQVKIHAKWGGVVPNLAAREHLKNCIPVINTALKESSIKLENIDLFAVTQGPGLIPALLIGTNVAKTLSYFHKKPLLGIHHVEGHIYANFVKNANLAFPMLALIVSGGHTQLVLMKKHFQYEIIGQTQDDAVGEAFDKVAKMLCLGYPGGPIVSQRAENFEKNIDDMKDKKLKNKLLSITFPRPMIGSLNFDFSFSGLKTAVLYFFKNTQTQNMQHKILELYKDAICFHFQKASVDVLTKKTFKAVEKFQPKTLLVAGGVAANKQLVSKLEEESKKVKKLRFVHPKLEYCGDNAAMIGIASFFRFNEMKKLGKLDKLNKNWKDLEADSNMKLQDV